MGAVSTHHVDWHTVRPTARCPTSDQQPTLYYIEYECQPILSECCGSLLRRCSVVGWRRVCFAHAARGIVTSGTQGALAGKRLSGSGGAGRSPSRSMRWWRFYQHSIVITVRWYIANGRGCEQCCRLKIRCRSTLVQAAPSPVHGGSKGGTDRINGRRAGFPAMKELT